MTQSAKPPQAFDDACRRWRDLYRLALQEFHAQSARSVDVCVPHKERDNAARRARDARIQLTLLSNEDSDDFQTDFYSYRYFASEGFLPGYSFPRLPLAAYIPGLAGRREGDYIQRPRFIGIGEFGPGAVIYHEGARYQVVSVALPPAEPGQEGTVTTDGPALPRLRLPASRSGRHRRLRALRRAAARHHPGPAPAHLGPHRAPGPDLLRRRGAPPGRIRAADLLPVRTPRRQARPDRRDSRRRERAAAQPRLRRLGHGPGHQHRPAPPAETRRARLHDRRDHGPLAQGERTGGPGRPGRGRPGRRRRGQAQAAGHPLRRGPPQHPGDPAVGRRSAPRPRSPPPSPWNAASRPRSSWKTASCPAKNCPDQDRRGRALFVESAEGGAGVLRRLVDDPGALLKAARTALQIMHFDPDTGADTSGDEPGTGQERCVRACYDCLLSYGNQRVHEMIDRHLVRDLMLRLASATVEREAAADPGSSARPENPVAAEFVAWLASRGLRLPDEVDTRSRRHPPGPHLPPAGRERGRLLHRRAGPTRPDGMRMPAMCSAIWAGASSPSGPAPTGRRSRPATRACSGHRRGHGDNDGTSGVPGRRPGAGTRPRVGRAAAVRAAQVPRAAPARRRRRRGSRRVPRPGTGQPGDVSRHPTPATRAPRSAPACCARRCGSGSAPAPARSARWPGWPWNPAPTSSSRC